MLFLLLLLNCGSTKKGIKPNKSLAVPSLQTVKAKEIIKTSKSEKREKVEAVKKEEENLFESFIKKIEKRDLNEEYRINNDDKQSVQLALLQFSKDKALNINVGGDEVSIIVLPIIIPDFSTFEIMLNTGKYNDFSHDIFDELTNSFNNIKSSDNLRELRKIIENYFKKDEIKEKFAEYNVNNKKDSLLKALITNMINGNPMDAMWTKNFLLSNREIYSNVFVPYQIAKAINIEEEKRKESISANAKVTLFLDSSFLSSQTLNELQYLFSFAVIKDNLNLIEKIFEQYLTLILQKRKDKDSEITQEIANNALNTLVTVIYPKLIKEKNSNNEVSIEGKSLIWIANALGNENVLEFLQNDFTRRAEENFSTIESTFVFYNTRDVEQTIKDIKEEDNNKFELVF